ncbi:uncharacterized protein BJ171DRAFT_489499 [Polychytrium aggregatum]|uniref:uncharacterized protein n=1 Tax=Polychytrium aggregatum TaxID=110093 RepID=UPI0022FE2966|nr:uncharacterized protein BJ171DRAFT_489499 [Polychytrium aggregatum]KAI9208603.1 hypothetical protein BJ171DRAFT_489499 [Polychytrium aggregatum]
MDATWSRIISAPSDALQAIISSASNAVGSAATTATTNSTAAAAAGSSMGLPAGTSVSPPSSSPQLARRRWPQTLVQDVIDSTASLPGTSTANGASKYSMENLRRIAQVLRKNQPQSSYKKDDTIAALNELADILVYSDSHQQRDLFEYFLEEKVHLVLIRYLYSDDDDVVLNTLKFYNVLFEGVKQTHMLYFLFSNNYINDVLLIKYNTANEEILYHFITLLKNLSIKLDERTIRLLYNEHLNDFPLFSEAVKHQRHEETMIRTAVRTIVLNVFKADDSLATQFIIEKRRYFATLCRWLSLDCEDLTEVLAAEIPDRYKLESIHDNITDQLLFIQDIFLLNIEYISKSLTETLTDHLLRQLLLDLSQGASETKLRQALYLMTFLVTIGHPPLTDEIVVQIFVDVLDRDWKESESLFRVSTMKRKEETRRSEAQVYRTKIMGLLEPSAVRGTTLLALMFVYSIVVSNASPRILKAAQLYPRRHVKSKSLMLALMNAPNDPADQSSSVPSYHSELISKLLEYLKSVSLTSNHPLIEIQLCVQIILELLSTGLKTEPLLDEHMRLLREIRQPWTNKLVEWLQQDASLFSEIFDFEASQPQASDLQWIFRDSRLLTMGSRRDRKPDETWTNGEMIDRSIKMWLVLSEMTFKFDPDAAYVPLRLDPVPSPPGDLVDLVGKKFVSCVYSDGINPSVNCYFVLDPYWFILVTPDKLQLGKGRMFKYCRHVDVDCLQDDGSPSSDSLALVASRADYITDSQRRTQMVSAPDGLKNTPPLRLRSAKNSTTTNASSAPGQSLLHRGSGFNVVSIETEWKAFLRFPESKNLGFVRAHIAAQKQQLREERRQKLEAFMLGNQ